MTTEADPINDKQSTRGRTENMYNVSQHNLNDSTFNLLTKKRTEKIRLNEALDILQGYYARYQTQCNGKEVPPEKAQDPYVDIYNRTLFYIETKNMSVKNTKF